MTDAKFAGTRWRWSVAVVLGQHAGGKFSAASSVFCQAGEDGQLTHAWDNKHVHAIVTVTGMQ